MRRRLAVWLVGSALLAATSFLVGCAVTAAVAPIIPATHQSYTPGTACDASDCHTDYTHKEPYLGKCETCHDLIAWNRVKYAHKDKTFDNGMHPLVGCEKCHTEGESVPKRTCSSCHEAPHKGLKACGSCHTTNAWGMRKPRPENHVSIDGGHSKLTCFDCHKAPIAPAKARTCTSCHGSNHGGLTQCQDCHDPSTGWNPKDGWSHSDFFVFRGVHKTLKCTQCHEGGVFPGTPKVCVGCHGKQHGGLSDCGGCHTTSGFKPTIFKHSTVFRLRGAHTKLKCSRCHPGREFAHTISNGGTACVDCHGPQHGGLTACANCHNTSSFAPATEFRHSEYFPLVGQHLTLSCNQCHPDRVFGHTISSTGGHACVGCHINDTPHPEQTNCASCHTPLIAWDVTLEIVHPEASVPLGSAHAWPNPCDRCHPGNVFSDPVTPCADCHSVDIPHVGPTTCVNCHRPTEWSDVHFAHPSIPSSSSGVPYLHTYRDFGPYPAGCVGCHPGTDPNPDFTVVHCASCH